MNSTNFIFIHFWIIPYSFYTILIVFNNTDWHTVFNNYNDISFYLD